MQTLNSQSIQFSEKPPLKPARTMMFVYIILGLSMGVFGASIWFSSYPKNVFLQRRPDFADKQEKIQNEIQALEIEENALIDVERIRKLIQELGLVESDKHIELKDMD